jgi:hypothetical protein
MNAQFKLSFFKRKKSMLQIQGDYEVRTAIYQEFGVHSIDSKPNEAHHVSASQ